MEINLSHLYKNQAIRYCIVGGMNTAATAIVIFSLTAAGCGLFASNFLGYVTGIVLSYILNTYFTFSAKSSLARVTKFLACCMGCYVINVLAMKLMLYLGFDNAYLIQLTGMVFYTVSGFFINKLWVMK